MPSRAHKILYIISAVAVAYFYLSLSIDLSLMSRRAKLLSYYDGNVTLVNEIMKAQADYNYTLMLLQVAPLLTLSVLVYYIIFPRRTNHPK
jgi:hypothetical protein